MSESDTTPETAYAIRRSAFERERAGVARRSARIARARVFVFVLSGLALVLFESASPWGRQALAAGALILGLVFLALVVAHTRCRERERWLKMRMRLCDEGIRRIRREWTDLPDLGPPPPRSPAMALDLDLFGRASLARLLGATTTTPGQKRLCRWLLTPSPTSEVPSRQEAVRELADLHDLRETVGTWGRILGSPTPESLDRLLAWAESDDTAVPAWARLAAWVLPGATLGLGAANLLGWIDVSLWLVPLVLSLALSLRTSPRLHERFRQVSSGEVDLAHYHPLFRLVSDREFESRLLAEARSRLSVGGLSAPAQLSRLLRLAHLSDAWRNAMFHWPLQILTLWDVHVALRLEAWRATAGAHVRDWIEALADVDALVGLATLRHENPSWCFPVIRPEADRLVARELLHPYLSPEVGVANDVEVGPPGTFLLVTGSNMSGKSTLLRALGVNVILARAGGPVAATAMRLPPVRLATSMRVQDSLEEGVSFFMAELQRLKAVVDAARDAGGVAVLYLLDEILQGTNTAERQIAARRVIRHLLDAGAIGAVTTHDLHLADAPDLAERSRAVHFRERFRRLDGEATLTFDYTLRPGLATSTNALTLMELVGLGEEPES